MLEAASERNRVELVAVVDQPVHMQQWRRLTELAARVTLISGWPGTRPARVEQAVKRVLRWTTFDTVLCTSARLWSRTLRTSQSYRVLDMDVPESRQLRQRTADVDPISGWRLARRAHGQWLREVHAAGNCDLLILSRRDDLLNLRKHAARTALAARHERDTIVELLSPTPATLGTTFATPETAIPPLRRAA